MVNTVIILTVLTSDWQGGIAHRVRKLVKRPENKRMLGWRRCVIGPEDVTVFTEDLHTAVKWRGILKIARTEEQVFLYITLTTAFLVPRSAFASEEEFREFVATARDYRDMARDPGSEKSGSGRKPAGEADTNIRPDRRTEA